LLTQITQAWASAKIFPGRQSRHSVVHFRLLTTQMQIDVHTTLYLCYTTKKMTHVTATVPKMRFVGSSVSFHTVQISLAAIFLFSFHIVRFFSHRDLLLSAVAASLHYRPQISAFKSHMQQNAYFHNFEPLLPCYCYVIKASFKTILPKFRNLPLQAM